MPIQLRIRKRRQGLATFYGNAANVQACAETLSVLVDGINNGAHSMASSLVGIVSAQNTYDHPRACLGIRR